MSSSNKDQAASESEQKQKWRAQADRGVEAERILNHPMVKEALEEMESNIVERWKNTGAEEDRQRYNAYLMYRLLNNFRDQFEQKIKTGKMAEKKLTQIKDRKIGFHNGNR